MRHSSLSFTALKHREVFDAEAVCLVVRHQEVHLAQYEQEHLEDMSNKYHHFTPSPRLKEEKRSKEEQNHGEQLEGELKAKERAPATLHLANVGENRIVTMDDSLQRGNQTTTIRLQHESRC